MATIVFCYAQPRKEGYSMMIANLTLIPMLLVSLAGFVLTIYLSLIHI